MNDDIVDKLLKYAGHANCAAIRIYNIIREVGRGELTADNALHQLVEDYHELSILSKNILKLTNELNKEGK